MKTALVCLFFAGQVVSLQAQDRADDWPWTTITESDSLRIAYLFYSEADNENNGVVLKLTNSSHSGRSYSFTVVFRTLGGAEASEYVDGVMQPNSEKTGENDGLFWIPFEDGREIAEVGLRRIRVAAKDDD